MTPDQNPSQDAQGNDDAGERIDVGRDADVRAWADRLGVQSDEVRQAVGAVGDRADAVREYLNAHHASPGK